MGGIRIHNQTWIIRIGIIITFIFIALFSWTDTFIFEETTLLEVAENSTYFEEGKPFVAESIVSGSLSFRNKETDAGVSLSQSDAQEIIALLATTKVRKTNRTIKNDRSQGEYMLDLDNDGYTMSYDVRIFLVFHKDKDSNEVFIGADFSDSNYLTEDLSIYNKLVEMIEKASSDL